MKLKKYLTEIVSDTELEKISAKWEAKGFNQAAVFKTSKHGYIYILDIFLPVKLRNKGLGTKFMEDVIKYADKNKAKIVLTPEPEGLENKEDKEMTDRLVNFYKRFGFVENEGKNRDRSIKQRMYRNPR